MTNEPEEFTIPEQNFGVFMLERMSAFGTTEALVDASTDTTYTYDNLIKRIRCLAAGFQKLGVKEGDVIAMLTGNSIDYPVAFLATVLIGAVFQPLSPLYTKDDISNACTNCSTKYIITLPELYEKVKDIAASLNAKVIVFGSAEGSVSFDSLIDQNASEFVMPKFDPKTTTAALFSSSGTTGRPKAVQMGHFGFIANTFQIYKSNPCEAGESMIVFLPMYHIYGLHCVTTGPLAHGTRLVIMSRFSPEGFLQLIQKHKARTLHVVPPVMVLFAKSPIVKKYDLSSVRKVFCGAAPLSPEVENAVKSILNLPLITQGYAMTETGVTHCNRDTRFKAGSSGQRLGQIEVKIVDIDTQETLDTGKEGEIMLRGPQMALGYLNLPEETANVFQADGWVHTGDIGYLDSEGFLFIVDRLKELIKYKGLQVPPASLEDILLKHDGIADAAVIGVPDEEAGELPRAFVVKKPAKEVTEAEIVSYVADKVAPHMKLRGGVEFVSEIPKSASGKILRRVLKAQLKQST